MIFKLTKSMVVLLILACCSCQEQPANMATVSSGSSRQHKDNPSESTVMVYYFHRTARCSTCLSIEAHAAQIVKNNFRQQLEDGRLMWVPFNRDEPGGAKFQKEFDITYNTLVVARTVDMDHVEFEKLDKVWQLLGDPDGFSEYVTDRINKFLNNR